ncbi:NF038104 family lipoprotein [uncultured Acinetobacter sp.]|uniref:NF038104 family lipoprotein n=1 Tax=uncultured Acinetobacter sp. TaxID=165433 RepID=UPI0025F9EB90|nr:NF038104 family lipoprotein [uncultured Acinetobacter sp.]
MIRVISILACVVMLQGCITKIVTVPVKIAYKTTKGVVKGTAAVVGAVIPDGDDDEKKEEKKNDNDD